METTSHRGYRSLFWPLILIGVGVVWLLSNVGIITGANLVVLLRLWPLLLIAIGLDLLFGRRSPALGALIGLGTLVVAIVLMLVGPGLGWTGDYEVKTASFSEPVGDARSAEVSLNLSVGRTTVSPLRDSSNLIEADLSYLGEVEFRAEGESHKVVELRHVRGVQAQFPFDFLGWAAPGGELTWDIGLSPNVDLNLTIGGGVGDASIDLSGLQLTDLTVNSGVGTIALTVPATGERYAATINSGVGDFTLTVAEGAAVELDINGGVGGFTIDVPDGAAVRLEANTGLGDVSVPGWLSRVSGDADNGVWETENFSGAENQISIQFDGGIGGLTIR